MFTKIKDWFKSLFSKDSTQEPVVEEKVAEKKQPSTKTTDPVKTTKEEKPRCLHCNKEFVDVIYSSSKNGYCYVMCKSCGFIMRKLNETNEIVAAENDLDVIAEAYQLFGQKPKKYAYIKDGDKLDCNSLVKIVEKDS